MTDDLPSPHPDAHAVLDFWFGDSLAHGWPVVPRKPLWFGNDPATDSTIRERFGALVAQAVAGGLQAWEASPPDRLALLVLLDQFTRNLHRGRAEAFAGDARACALARDMLDRGLDRQLPPIGRVFVLMPLMHAEDLALAAGLLWRPRRKRLGMGPDSWALLLVYGAGMAGLFALAGR